MSLAQAPVVRTGYLTASSTLLAFTPRHSGDLVVASVVNDSWANHVQTVSGGDVSNWAPAGPAFYDGSDGQILQIFFGTSSGTSPSTVQVGFSGTVGNADVAVEEVTSGSAANWSLASYASAGKPFPALSAPAGGGVYVGEAMAWGDAAAGTTTGVDYLAPSSGYLLATDTSANGDLAPTGTGSGSVAAMFAVDSTGTGTGAASGLAPTTTTVAPTTTTTVAPTTTTVAPTTTTAAPTTTTTVAPSGAPPASYMPGSLFNSNVTGWSVDTGSAQYVNDFVNDYQTHYGSVGVNSAPVYEVPSGTAVAAISVTSGCNNFLPSTGTQVPVPSFIHLNGSSDNPLILYQPSSGKEWEFWQMKQLSSSSYSACWGGEAPLATTNGVFPTNYGLSATGISYLATTITEADVASGSINHAIAVVLPRCNSFTYPANRGDCGSDPGQPAEGQWFRFAPGTTCPASECFTPFATMVFNAIKTYGMVVIDQGGAVMIEQEQASDWAAEGHSGTDPITASQQGYAEYQVVADLPWQDMQVVAPPR